MKLFLLFGLLSTTALTSQGNISIGIVDIRVGLTSFAAQEIVNVSNQSIVEIEIEYEGNSVVNGSQVSGQLFVIFKGKVLNGWEISEYGFMKIDIGDNSGVLSIMYTLVKSNEIILVSDSVFLIRDDTTPSLTLIDYPITVTQIDHQESPVYKGDWRQEDDLIADFEEGPQFFVSRGHWGLLNETWNNNIDSLILIQDGKGLRPFNGSIYGGFDDVYFLATISQGYLIQGLSNTSDTLINSLGYNRYSGTLIFDVIPINFVIRPSINFYSQTEIEEYKVSFPDYQIAFMIIIIFLWRKR